MNNTVHIDPSISDDERRSRVYDGQLFVYLPRKSSLAFINFARQLNEEASAPNNPETAQRQMPVEQYAGTLSKLKPHFIHHPESKRPPQAIVSEMGCELDDL